MLAGIADLSVGEDDFFTNQLMAIWQFLLNWGGGGGGGMYSVYYRGGLYLTVYIFRLQVFKNAGI